jgi:hypothetical protein
LNRNSTSLDVVRNSILKLDRSIISDVKYWKKALCHCYNIVHEYRKCIARSIRAMYIYMQYNSLHFLTFKHSDDCWRKIKRLVLSRKRPIRKSNILKWCNSWTLTNQYFGRGFWSVSKFYLRNLTIQNKCHCMLSRNACVHLLQAEFITFRMKNVTYSGPGLGEEHFNKTLSVISNITKNMMHLHVVKRCWRVTNLERKEIILVKMKYLRRSTN